MKILQSNFNQIRRALDETGLCCFYQTSRTFKFNLVFLLCKQGFGKQQMQKLKVYNVLFSCKHYTCLRFKL